LSKAKNISDYVDEEFMNTKKYIECYYVSQKTSDENKNIKN
jgi:hypothetical protein